MNFNPPNIVYDLESYINEKEPLLKISDRLKRVNELCVLNDKIGSIETSKIQYEVLLEDMNVSEKELDLMYLAQNFVFARRCLIAYIGNEKITPFDAIVINKVYGVLLKYNMQHTLIGDLNIRKYNKVIKMTEKYI